MIEVFKTTCPHMNEAMDIIAEIVSHYPELAVNFDLADCDRILRIKSKREIPIKKIEEILSKRNIACEVLN